MFKGEAQSFFWKTDAVCVVKISLRNPRGEAESSQKRVRARSCFSLLPPNPWPSSTSPQESLEGPFLRRAEISFKLTQTELEKIEKPENSKRYSLLGRYRNCPFGHRNWIGPVGWFLRIQASCVHSGQQESCLVSPWRLTWDCNVCQRTTLKKRLAGRSAD